MMFYQPARRLFLLSLLLCTFVPAIALAQPVEAPLSQTSNPQEKNPAETYPSVDTTASLQLERILVHVGDTVITKTDYEQEFGSEHIEAEKLQNLVDQKLIQLASRKVGVDLSSDNLERQAQRRIDQLKLRSGDEKFREQLRLQGLTELEYQQQLVQQMKRQQKLSAVLFSVYPDLKPGEDTTAFNARPTRVKARLMLLPDTSTARRAHELLEGRKSWEEVFEEYSEKLIFMDEAGDLGWFEWGTYGRELEYRLFTLPLYGVSNPFQFRSYQAIVQKTGIRLVPPWESVDSQSRRYWQNYRFQHYKEKLIELLHKHYTVRIPDSLDLELPADHSQP